LALHDDAKWRGRSLIETPGVDAGAVHRVVRDPATDVAPE
jgi:hypothetical protein